MSDRLCSQDDRRDFPEQAEQLLMGLAVAAMFGIIKPQA